MSEAIYSIYKYSLFVRCRNRLGVQRLLFCCIPENGGDVYQCRNVSNKLSPMFDLSGKNSGDVL
jgi:hypothetical protein